MRNSPKISVLIPVYNAKNYLDECIQSVLNQSFPDFELILINDGSTDNSGTICDSYAVKDNRVKVFHQKNAGPSVARNLGIKKAQGDYIVFIDSDDYVKTEFLESFFLEEKTPKNILVQQGFIRGRKDKYKEYREPTSIYTAQEYSLMFYETQFLWRKPFIWAKLFDGNLIKKHKIKFPEEVKYGEDLIFLLDYLYYSQKIIFINKTLYHSIYAPESLSQKINNYKSEVSALNYTINSLKQFEKKFDFTSKTKNFHRAYLSKYLFRVFFSLYLLPNREPKNLRKQNLKEIISNGNIFLFKYKKPLGKFQKTVMVLSSKNLVGALDFFIKLFFKYRKDSLDKISK